MAWVLGGAQSLLSNIKEGEGKGRLCKAVNTTAEGLRKGSGLVKGLLKGGTWQGTWQGTGASCATGRDSFNGNPPVRQGGTLSKGILLCDREDFFNRNPFHALRWSLQDPEHLDREIKGFVAGQWVELERPDTGKPYFYNLVSERVANRMPGEGLHLPRLSVKFASRCSLVAQE